MVYVIALKIELIILLLFHYRAHSSFYDCFFPQRISYCGSEALIVA